MEIGDFVIRKGKIAQIVKPSYPRFGEKRVVIREIESGKTYVVQVRRLIPAPSNLPNQNSV